MKTIALDIGDKWTGVALSDPLGILARPHTTTKTSELLSFLENIFAAENISVAIVGLPTTLRGTQSEQTKKIITTTQNLEKLFPTITWKMWDERFTSRQAASIKPSKSKADKLQSHAIAAALILSGYLESQRLQVEQDEE